MIDIEELVAPIDGDNPAGVDLRESRSEEYYQIKDARNAARAEERSALMEETDPGAAMATWRLVLELSPKVLTEQSKDLEVCTWYIEALVRSEGFSGLRDGITLVNRLVAEYWEHLYPLPDEDGMETKVAPLTGLNGDGAEGTLIAPIRNLEITAPDSFSGDFSAFSLWQYQQALEVSKITDPEKKSQRQQRQGYSLEDVEKAVRASSSAFFLELMASLEETLSQYQALGQQLSKYCGADTPPNSNVIAILEEVQRSVRFVAKDKLTVAAPVEAAAETAADDNDSATTPAAVQGSGAAQSFNTQGAVGNRDDALLQLSEIAKFFRATEPHTPIASGIERLVKWGKMPVGELMGELMPDTNARNIFRQLTGVEFTDGADMGAPVVAPSQASDNNSYAASSPQESTTNNDQW